MIKYVRRIDSAALNLAVRAAIGGSVLLMALAGGSSIAIAQSTPAAAAPATASAEPKIPVLNRAQVDALLAQGDKVLFIDVRRPDEVATIGGFPVYLSIQLSELERLADQIPKDRQIVVVSNHAGRGEKGAQLLAARGLNVVGATGAETYEKEGGSPWNKTVLTPDIPGVVKGGTVIGLVHEGFNGTEGPAVQADGSILFTENRANRIVKIAGNGTVSAFLENDGGTNALAVSPAGEVFGAQTAEGATGIVELAPVKKVITTGPKGAPFVRPNDFARSASGNFYVSDPGAYQNAAKGGVKPTGPIKTGFYWVNPKGKVTLVAEDITFPNGVALSADEKTVYVANTQGESLIAFSVNPDGSLTARHDFGHLAGFKDGKSGADGIAVDNAGRVFVSTDAGVEVFDATGAALGVIKLPRHGQNLVFGGKDRDRLFVVGRGSVYRIQTLTKGPDRLGK